jgi:DNA-binding beta-propeller fold protein YncE
MHRSRKWLHIVASLAVVLAAGCGGTPASTNFAALPNGQAGGTRLAAHLNAIAGIVHPARRGGGWLSAAAKSGKPLVYVSDFLKNTVEIYDASGSNQSPIGQITDGISGPEGCSVDRKGDLFVTNATNFTVTMYPRGSTSYTLLCTGFAYPTNVAVGADGMVYVVDLVGKKVVEFPKGKTRSKRTISISYPQGAALDAANNLYISHNTGANGAGPGDVEEYAPGSTTGTSLNLPIVWSAGNAVDRHGNVVVADQGSGIGNAAVYAFPPGSTTPSLTITQNIEDPFRLAFDKRFKHLYVADPEVGAVLVYDYPSGTYVNTIQSGLSSAYGVAVTR